MGLVNRVVDYSKVLESAMELSEKIARNNMTALKATKEIVIKSLSLPLQTTKISLIFLGGEFLVTLALLYLVVCDRQEGLGSRAWKGFDWETMNRLHEKDFISNPKGKAKSVLYVND